MEKWYLEPTREEDDPHFPSSSRVRDALSGADRTSNHVPIEDDEDRLAMKKGGMPPPVPERVANPRIREDQAFQEFHSNSDRTYSATSDDDFTQAWFDYGRFVFPQSVRKKVQTLTLITCQRTSAASSSTLWVPSNGKVISGDRRT